jgi:hypothetical protein
MPDMQTALKTALATSKVPLKPKGQLIWEHLKDRPNQTNKQLEATFKSLIVPATIKALTGQMLRRKMLVVEAVKTTGRGNFWYRYSVNPSMHGVYELLPVPPKKVKEAAPVEAAEPPPQAQPVSAEPPPQAQPVSAEQKPAVNLLAQVDQLTLLEAKKVYDYLHTMFGGR